MSYLQFSQTDYITFAQFAAHNDEKVLKLEISFENRIRANIELLPKVEFK